MNYDKIKRTGILFLLGIGAITSLSCNDNDNAQPERVGNVAAVPGGKIVGEGAPDMPMLRLSLSRRM